ncbi:MAG: hypothetical protein HOW97_41240 [Catenulispora sp.]|nr:hypothetical protein [Catenulispora sp.]
MRTDDAAASSPGDAVTAQIGTVDSTSVSCLLMQDAVPADVVSVGSGQGKVALFANTFLDGKQEALVVNAESELTYLRRTPDGTGWSQDPVIDAAAPVADVAAVVVFVHPRDQSTWAVYAPKAGKPRALRLTASEPGGTTAWQGAPNAIDFRGDGPDVTALSHMSLFYFNGRTPAILAIDANNSHLVRITVLTYPDASPGHRFNCISTKAVVTGPGPVDEFVATGGSSGAVGYVRSGSTIREINTTVWDEPVAADAASLVGTFLDPSQDSVGLVYLDDRRNLVVRSPAIGGNGVTVTRTPGLGFVTARLWVDAVSLLHVYGIDGAGRLQVLHQRSWGESATPVWSASTAAPPPAGRRRAAADPPTTVVTCVGLLPGVAWFALDPYPGQTPSQLVELSGEPVAAERFSILTQRGTAARWSRDKVRLPSGGAPHLVTRYVSEVTMLDGRGQPVPGLPVRLWAEALTEIQSGGASYLVGPGHTTSLTTDPSGRIVLAQPADSLLPAVLHVDAVGLRDGAVIQPAAAVHDYLAGFGSLPSQPTRFGTDALVAARAGNRPVVDPLKHDRDAVAGVVDAVTAMFKLADGKTVPHFSIGTGHALLRGHAPGAAPVEHRTLTADQVRAHVEAIERLPHYGGSWEDFLAWGGDVWQGIVAGVIDVAHIVYDGALKIYITISGALVRLADFEVATIVEAVHAVEAAFRLVVDDIEQVLDWLKALFEFDDIWDSKRALHGTMETLLSYATASIDHFFFQLPEGWFQKQQDKLHTACEQLKKDYGKRPVGDAVDRTPKLTDSAGNATTPMEMQSNPQSTWMMRQIMAAGDPEVDAAQLDPLASAFTGFLADVQAKHFDTEISKILGDLKVLLDAIVDPTDPDGAPRATMTAFFDLLENLGVTALRLLDLAVETLRRFFQLLGTYAWALLSAPIEAEGLVTLYRWIQEQAGVPEAEREDPSLAGLFFLALAFGVTTMTKLIRGVDQPPFPGGLAPVIPAPPWHPAYEARSTAAGDPASNDGMKTWQLISVFSSALAIPVSYAADRAPLEAEGLVPAWDMFYGVCDLVFGTGFGAMLSMAPPVSGADWNSPLFMSFLSAGCQALFSIGACAWKLRFWLDPESTAILRNVGGVSRGPIMQLFTSGLSLMGVVLYYGRNPETHRYNYAQMVLSLLPSIVGVLRLNAFPGDESFPYRVAGTAYLNAGISGISTLMAGVAAASPRPAVLSGQKFTARAGDTTTYKVRCSGGTLAFNAPLKDFKLSGVVPPWLSIDEETGEMTARPPAGTRPAGYGVTVSCWDSYEPPQASLPKYVEVTVA